MEDTFVSCMKIRGVSILPPLITPKRREELLEYKKKAILLEQSYEKKRLSHDLLEEKYTENVESETTIINCESTQSVCSENDLEVGIKYVPYASSQHDRSSLSINNKDVCECKQSEEVSDDISNIDECELKFSQDKKEPGSGTNEGFEYSHKHQCVDSGKPRLIRSNSYTLDNPSSILLDHLKRHTSSSCDQTITSGKKAEIFRSLEWKPNKTKDNYSDEENLIDLTSNVPKTKEIHDINETNVSNQPCLEVITTDITVQQINFTTSDMNEKNVTEKLSTCGTTDTKSFGDEDDVSSIQSTDPEIELQSILQQIPENYAKKIVQLIEIQKKEQQRRAQNYENIKTGMLQSGDFENNSSVEVNSPKKIFVTSASQSNLVISSALNSEISRSGSIVSHYSTVEKSLASSLNESQTLPFDVSTSSSESLDNFSLRTFRILDLGGKSNDIIECPDKMNNFFPQNVISKKDVVREGNEHNDLKKMELQKFREIKAASIIGAYAKGYLVRRLMNTAKVKRIIQTIQDALVCALELQRSETIEEADVELHRKLIKLVSSACYEFHDIFFALTISEQMDIIAIDREKVKKILAVRNTRSSTEFRNMGQNATNIKSSSSLTRI